MLKKALFVLASLSASAVFANSAPYVGASLGVVTNTDSTGGNFRGVPVSVFAGYGGTLTPMMYLGGELLGILGTANINDDGNDRTTSGYSVSVIPGLMLSGHTMLLGRLGVVRNRFNDANNDYSTGGQIGVGLQTSITQEWDIRGEYDYAKFNKVNGIHPRQDQASLGIIYKFD